MNRRDFLKGLAGVTAAGIALPGDEVVRRFWRGWRAKGAGGRARIVYDDEIANTPIDPGDGLDVNFVQRFEYDFPLIQVDDEIMAVTGISGQTLSVIRGAAPCPVLFNPLMPRDTIYLTDAAMARRMALERIHILGPAALHGLDDA